MTAMCEDGNSDGRGGWWYTEHSTWISIGGRVGVLVVAGVMATQTRSCCVAVDSVVSWVFKAEIMGGNSSFSNISLCLVSVSSASVKAMA